LEKIINTKTASFDLLFFFEILTEFYILLQNRKLMVKQGYSRAFELKKIVI